MEAGKNVTSKTNLEVYKTWKDLSFITILCADKKGGLFSCSSTEYIWWIAKRFRRRGYQVQKHQYQKSIKGRILRWADIRKQWQGS